MRLLRRLHLYLGCFFAPLLLFYVTTGWYQTVTLRRNKVPGEAEDWLGRLRSVHVDQIYPAVRKKPAATVHNESVRRHR